MLPFLANKKPKAAVGVIVKERTPDEQPESEEDMASAGLEACAMDLIDAVHAKDVQKVAQVLQDAFDLMEAKPHEEIEEGAE